MPIMCPRNITVKEMSKNSVSWISHFGSEKSTAKKRKKKSSGSKYYKLNDILSLP